jgi:hypothetical protein
MTERPGEYTVVNVKSAWLSQINWVQIVGMLASVLTLVGFNLTVEHQAAIVVIIQGLVGIYTVVRKTWFTTSITPQSAKKL